MEQKVDPAKVMELAGGMKRLNRTVEDRTMGMQRDIGSLIQQTRNRYPECYVQSAAYGAESLLTEMRALAMSISERMDKKADALTWAAEEYRKEEEKAKEKAKVKLVKDTRKIYEYAWSGYQKVGVGLYSWYKGYKFKVKGNYVHVYGPKKVSGFWGNSYLKWRTSDKLTGTRYRIDNPVLAKHLKPSAAVKAALNDSWNVMNPKAWKNSLKGGGLLGPALTVGGSVYSYGWGEHKEDGLASTEFVSDLAVETTVAVGATVVSTAAGVGTAALIGAAYGSVIPGLGTAVGFAVGVGIGLLISSEPGQKAMKWTKEKVNAGLEFGKAKAKEAIDEVGKAASRVIGGLNRCFSWG